MLDITLQCTFCLFFIYKGSKFNMLKKCFKKEKNKEIISDNLDFWLLNKLCPKCNNNINYTTDLDNVDYKIISGAF